MLPLVAVNLLLSLLLQTEHGTPSSRVTGILELPEIFGEFACDRYTPQPMVLHSLPSADSPQVGVLEVIKPWYVDDSSPCEEIEVGFRNEATSDIEDVRFREYSYEEPGLIVTESNGDWFRVDLGSILGWIHPPTAERFHSYEELVKESLAYVPPNWDGRLWESPGIGDPAEVPPAWRPYMNAELTMEVVEDQFLGGELWFKIRLDPEYGCGSLPDAPPLIEGWVPGYRATGENMMWFYSRGC